MVAMGLAEIRERSLRARRAAIVTNDPAARRRWLDVAEAWDFVFAAADSLARPPYGRPRNTPQSDPD
jgi:hypothetical protein